MHPQSVRRTFVLLFPAAIAVALGAAGGLFGTCGPFTDVAADAFCPFVLEVFTMNITTGTTPTTYEPANNVTRLQMAAFLSRTVDRTLQRGSRRIAMDQFWTPQGPASLGLTTLPITPVLVKFDGLDLWVSNNGGLVHRVRATDGKVLDTWTGAGSAKGVLAAMGKIFVSGGTNLYRIDPTQPAGAVATIATNLGADAQIPAFDGARIFVTGFAGSVSIVTPGATIPWTVTTVTTGFTSPGGILYDGANIWITDRDAGKLLKLDSNAAILQTVTVGTFPVLPAFDGTNIWVPNFLSSSVSVVRVSSGAVLATLTGNGLNFPYGSATDGQRLLVTNANGNTVSLWKAADLSVQGTFLTGLGTQPGSVCSDGANFWILLSGTSQLAKF